MCVDNAHFLSSPCSVVSWARLSHGGSESLACKTTRLAQLLCRKTYVPCIFTRPHLGFGQYGLLWLNCLHPDQGIDQSSQRYTSLWLGFSLFCILGLCVSLGFEHFPKFKRTLSVSSKIHADINAFRQIEISLYLYPDSTVSWHALSPRIPGLYHETSLGKSHCVYPDSTVSWHASSPRMPGLYHFQGINCIKMADDHDVK